MNRLRNFRVAAFHPGRGVFFGGRLGRLPDFEAEVLPYLVDEIIVQRAGMGELLENSHLRERFDNFFRFHFELPRQLIDSNLLHKRDCCRINLSPT